MSKFLQMSHGQRSPGRLAAMAAGGILVLASAGLADCTPGWLPGGGLPGLGGWNNGNDDGNVRSATMWDPDGPGGQDPVLVVAGSFGVAGDIQAGNIAVWDGASWSTLGDGLGPEAIDFVSSVTVYNGQLIAAGRFTSSGGGTPLGNIARWNGSSWEPLSAGPINDMNNGEIDALAIYDNKLVAAGTFTRVNSTTDNIRRIAAWDGSMWSPLSSTATNGINDGQVNALAVYDNKLIAAGTFTQVDSTTANFLRIAQWNGSAWSAVSGTAVNGINDGKVYALTVYDNKLVAGGTFTQVDSTTANFLRIAAWNGSAWSPVSATATNGINDGEVDALMVYGGNLIAGGRFAQVDSTTDDFASIASWNGSAWSPLSTFAGTVGNIRMLTAYDGELVAGGSFREIRPAASKLFSIAGWDGSTWHGLYSGSATDGEVHALSRLENGDVAVGGQFTLVEGIDSRYVASLNSTFGGSPLAGGLFVSPLTQANLALGVLKVMQVPSSTAGPLAGRIFAGGWEIAATDGGSPVLIAQSDGTVWSNLPTPLVAGELIPGLFFGGVSDAVVMPNGNLAVSGYFFFPGNPTPCLVALWDGATWTRRAGGVFGESVDSLAVMPNGDLIAGGLFTSFEGAPSADNVARWDGTFDSGLPVWQAMGKGAQAGVNVVHVMSDGKLMMGGSFEAVGNAAAGDTVAKGVAIWNPATQTWSQPAQGLSRFGGGSGGWAYAMTTMPDGTLAVGGDFVAVGNAAAADTPASSVAIWNPTTQTWSALGDGVGGAILYHKVYALATTADGTLVVGGDFTTAGGQLSPYIARWGCTGTVCEADFNGVNGVTVQDIFDFLTAWLAGNSSADFNHVNGVTVQDIFDFLTAWLAGC